MEDIIHVFSANTSLKHSIRSPDYDKGFLGLKRKRLKKRNVTSWLLDVALGEHLPAHPGLFYVEMILY